MSYIYIYIYIYIYKCDIWCNVHDVMYVWIALGRVICCPVLVTVKGVMEDGGTRLNYSKNLASSLRDNISHIHTIMVVPLTSIVLIWS